MDARQNLFVAGAALVSVLAASSLFSQTSEHDPAVPVPSEKRANNDPLSGSAPPVQRFVMPPPPPRVDPDAYKMTSSVDVVLLDVSVKNDDGGFVSGLKKEDFKVFEDKVEQPVSIFGAADVPVTVGLVVDNSGSVRPKKPEIVTAALTFVTNSNPQDEVFVVNFNDRVMLGLPDGVPFSSDRGLLREALLSNPAQGRTALNDAIKLALDHLEKGHLDKKTLVVISDGGDNSSDTTKREIIDLIEKSAATVYTIGIFNPDDDDKNPGFLKDIAKITGGVAFMPGGIENLVQTCERIAHDIRNRYTLGYTPSNKNFDGKKREVKVIARDAAGEKLDVRTRSYYYATKREGTRSRAAGETGSE
jgi:VWFA-related protein